MAQRRKLPIFGVCLGACPLESFACNVSFRNAVGVNASQVYKVLLSISEENSASSSTLCTANRRMCVSPSLSKRTKCFTASRRFYDSGRTRVSQITIMRDADTHGVFEVRDVLELSFCP